MTDLCLIGIFILCIVTGYILVKRSGGFLEQMLFQKPEVWYHLRESNEPCRTETGADAGACSREDASGRRKIERSYRSRSESDAAPARDPREKRSVFGRGTAKRTKELKAGVRHEWKADSRRPNQHVWKPQ